MRLKRAPGSQQEQNWFTTALANGRIFDGFIVCSEFFWIRRYITNIKLKLMFFGHFFYLQKKVKSKVDTKGVKSIFMIKLIKINWCYQWNNATTSECYADGNSAETYFLRAFS